MRQGVEVIDHIALTHCSQDIPSDAPYSSRDWPQVEKNYAAMVSTLDRQLGQILDLVATLGVEQQTLVVFTSDNGPSAEALHRPDFFRSAGPFRGHKREVYEGGIRVPLLAQWKGTIAPGSVSRDITAFWDLLPTAAELAGLPPPARTDGISLVPSLLGKPRAAHEYLYWDYGHARESFLQGLRQGPWKAVRNGSREPLELYNLDRDPGEQTDLASSNPAVARRMAALFEKALQPSPDYPIKDRAAPGAERPAP